MKNFSVFGVIGATLFPVMCMAQSVPVISVFSSIELNADDTITVTPYHPYMMCGGKNCGDKITLQKDEEYSFGEHHAFGSVIYKGKQDNQLVFEDMSGFDAVSFGGDVSQNTKEKRVSPYTKEQFADGREKEILDRMPLSDENKPEIMRLINKVGDKNQLLWDKSYDLEYVKFLLEIGADVNTINNDGETLLFWAVLRNGMSDSRQFFCDGRTNYIQYLLSHGANIHHKNKDGKEIADLIPSELAKCDSPVLKQNQIRDCDCLAVAEKVIEGINPIMANQAQCEQWPNFEMVYSRWRGKTECLPKCPKNTIRNGEECYNCNYKYGIDVDENVCKQCPNRKMGKAPNGVMECLLDYPTCPDNMILVNDFMGEAECYPCDQNGGLETSKEECDKCSNRHMTHYGHMAVCAPSDCPKGQFMAYGIRCIDCGELESYNMTAEEECLKCSNRKMIDNRCVLAECPTGTFRSSLGICESCDESGNTVDRNVSEAECARCPQREMVNGICAIKECPERKYRTNSGDCSYCGWDDKVPTTKEQCDKCSGREYRNGLCVLK